MQSNIILRRRIRGVGPHVAGGVVGVEHLIQPCPVVGRDISAGPVADQRNATSSIQPAFFDLSGRLRELVGPGRLPGADSGTGGLFAVSSVSASGTKFSI